MKLTEEQKLLQKLISKAWENETFKTELIANPIEIIENFLAKSLNLPKGKTIVVYDQTDISTIHINIPAKPNMDDLELNEEQLKTIAGGNQDKIPPVIIGAAATLNGLI